MANTFTENRDQWLRMSEIDYLGQFVKAWLAFNAWYRSAYAARKDHDIINEIKWNANPIASNLRPLLTRKGEIAEQFRAEIGLLYHRLENYEIHHGKGDQKTRISFRQIVVRIEPPRRELLRKYGYQLEIERIQNGSVTVKVENRSGVSVVSLQQSRFDLSGLEDDAAFQTLSENLKGRCRRLYERVNPQMIIDLTAGDEEALPCGTHAFRCGVDFLFAGVVEVIYLMRCSLFHGELVPTREASECYEPAYRIVRRFLEAVT